MLQIAAQWRFVSLLCVLISSSFLAWALALARTLGACGGFGLCASLCETTSQINSAYFKRMPPPLRVLSYCYSQYVITQKLHDGAAGAWLRHPRTADQGTARAFSSRTTEQTEQSREKVRLVRAVMQRAVFCGRSCTLPSCVCFTAVYCTRTRGPVRNRTEPEVPLICGGPVRPKHAGSFDCEGTRWSRTRDSVARGRTRWIFWIRLLYCQGSFGPQLGRRGFLWCCGGGVSKKPRRTKYFILFFLESLPRDVRRNSSSSI